MKGGPDHGDVRRPQGASLGAAARVDAGLLHQRVVGYGRADVGLHHRSFGTTRTAEPAFPIFLRFFAGPFPIG